MAWNSRTRKFIIRFSLAAIFVCFLIAVMLMFKVQDDHSSLKGAFVNLKTKSDHRNYILQRIRKEVDLHVKQLDDAVNSIKNISRGINLGKFLASERKNYSFTKGSSGVKNNSLNYNVHVFYYPWYGNPKFDGRYLHWNHPFMPHWDKIEQKKWPKGNHKPPEDIGANFYPQMGTYSSRDPEVIEKHVQQIAKAGIGVMSVSWYPPGDSDPNGIDPDSLMPTIMDISVKYKVKVAFHIEPYKGRDHISLKKHLKYIIEKYGNHPSFYRHYSKEKDKHLPLFYIYDSYQVKYQNWAQIFKNAGSLSVRDTELDGIFIGLMVERKHKTDIYSGGFDGFYTYFATEGFTYGSTWQNWQDLQAYARSHDKIFIPSVAPGYIDTNVRPWNGKNTRKRKDGTYYKKSFEMALSIAPDLISITSFNEWHEGTQIEPAVPMKNLEKYVYLDYEKGGPNFYLNLTKMYVDRFSQMKNSGKYL